MDEVTKRNRDVRRKVTAFIALNLDSVATLTVLQASEVDVRQTSDGGIQMWVTMPGSSIRVPIAVTVSIPV